tara:strand:+ start:1904 stop:2542 length:639 start_codon:yes stop_codon:yes gene_type:complete
MIILSKGKLDLHNDIIDTFVERHATTRIKNNTLTEDTVKFFVFFLLHESTFPISCMFFDPYFNVNPGKSRLYANYFLNKETIDCIMMSPHVNPFILKESKTVDLNYSTLIDDLNKAQIEPAVIDEEKVLVLRHAQNIDKSIFRNNVNDTWNKNFGSIKWYQNNNLLLEVQGNSDSTTKIEISHAFGVYESLCSLLNISNYKHFGNFDIISQN